MNVELPQGLTFIERGWLSSNTVIVDDGAECVCIDTGYVTHASLLLRLLDSHLADRALDLIVNTHLHSDHCGGNHALLQQFPNVKTLIPYGLFDAVDAWDHQRLSFNLTGQHCPRFRVNQALYPGDLCQWAGFEWEIHAAPGHDHDALLFFNPLHRILISADALWINGFGVVFPEVCGDKGFEEVSATLDVIESLNPLLVLPGHGPAIWDIAKSLQISRSKLARFVNEPKLHASHAAKVLLKFHLLEWQSRPILDFKQWAKNTPLIINLHQHGFLDIPIELWLDSLIQELVAKNASRLDGAVIHNI